MSELAQAEHRFKSVPSPPAEKVFTSVSLTKVRKMGVAYLRPPPVLPPEPELVVLEEEEVWWPAPPLEALCAAPD